MPKLLWTILCQRAIIDGRTNTVTLVDVLEDVNVPAPPDPEAVLKQEPLIPMKFALVTLWEKEKTSTQETVKGRVRLQTPSGKDYGGADFELAFPLSKMRVVTEAPGFKYGGPGRYLAKVELRAGNRWRAVGQTSFELKFLPAQKTS